MTKQHCYLAGTCVIATAFLFGIGSYSLLEPDEGRNAEVAREMAQANDYGVPHLNELPYLDKPVLFFAAGAAAMEILGPTEFAARLPSFLFTIGTIALVAWFGRKHFGPDGGWIAGIAATTTPLTLAFSRTVIFDSTLTFWVTLAILGFVSAGESMDPENKDRSNVSINWTIAAWAALAFGVLTKGPIALAFPFMVVIPYLIWRRRARALWDAVGFFLFLAIILPWLYIMSREVPGFLEYALVVETTKRLFTDELKRTEPFWYFFPILLAGALPWSLVPLSALKKIRARAQLNAAWDPHFVLLALWVVVPLIFFTLSQSKRPQYMVPIIPAIGLMVAWLWHREPLGNRLPGARGAGIILTVIGAVLLASRSIVSGLIDISPPVLAAIPNTALIIATVSVGVGVAVFFLANRRQVVVLLLALPVTVIPFASLPLMQAIGDDRSAASLAEAMEPLMNPETEIVAVHTYPLSLPFYLAKTLTVVTDDAEELTSNYLLRTHGTWANMPNSPLRPTAWWIGAMIECDRPRIFVVASSDHANMTLLERRLPLIAVSRKYAAYGPCSTQSMAFLPTVTSSTR